jgi:hypothetical protein
MDSSCGVKCFSSADSAGFSGLNGAVCQPKNFLDATRVRVEQDARIAEAIAAFDRRFSEALSRFNETLYKSFSQRLAVDVAAKITPEVIAESLSKKVLVTRPTQRHEMAGAVVVRPAQRHESK